MVHFDASLLGGVIFTGVGAAALFQGFRELGRAADSEEWPRVPGEIEESGVLADPSGRSVTYYPEVRYHYRVGDQQFVSDRIAFGGVVSMSFRSWAEGIVHRYRKSKNVTVAVCPTNPDLSVLEPGVHWTCWFVVGIGAVFFGLGMRDLLHVLGVLS